MTYIWYQSAPSTLKRCVLISGSLAVKSRVRVSPYGLHDVEGTLRQFGRGGWLVVV